MSEERLLHLLGQVNDEYILEANPLIKNRKNRAWIRWCAMAAGICLVLSSVFWGQQVMDVYAMETSYISIDVNPSIELCLNKYDRVVNVIAYNEEGQRVVDCLDVKNKCYTDALEEILHNEVFCSYMRAESDVTFTIVSDKEEVLRAGIESCAQGMEHHGTINCSDTQTRQRAHDNHCSVGKYSAYEELVQYDDTVTIEECRDMSVHEIHNRINECKSHHGTSGSSSTNSSDNSITNGNENTFDTEYDYPDNNNSGHHREQHHQ